jgi:hypothetical protein
LQADFAIELGRDDETLELPWTTTGDGPRYYDLKRHPESLTCIEEANRVAGLAEFLGAVNSQASIVQTAKCDVWASTEINPEEEIFSAKYKFGSYVDLLFADEPSRFSFDAHEQFAKQMTKLLKRVPEIPASSEFLVRRCFYHSSETAEPRDGFYVTHYQFGYGNDEAQARQQWAIGMKLVENAIRQISAGR